MLEQFKQDAARWIQPGQIGDPSILTLGMILRLLYRHLPLRALGWYRLACWCRAKRIPGACGLIVRWIHFRFGLEMWGNIGGGLYIAHTVGTIIAVKQMGQNCSVIASATLGMRNTPAFPVLGDEVFIGAGARVLGGIHLGNGAKVGANAVVTKDVPESVTVVGIPAKPLYQDGLQINSLTREKNGHAGHLNVTN